MARVALLFACTAYFPGIEKINHYSTKVHVLNTRMKYNNSRWFDVHAEFGRILKGLRKNKGLNQTQLGEMAGLNKALVSKYENSQSYPSYNALIRIAKLFQVSTDYLLGVEGSKTMDADGLSAEQIDMLIGIATQYRELNEKLGVQIQVDEEG